MKSDTILESIIAAGKVAIICAAQSEGGAEHIISLNAGGWTLC